MQEGIEKETLKMEKRISLATVLILFFLFYLAGFFSGRI